MDKHYRHENKYPVDAVLIEKVRMRMNALLQLDENAGQDGRYEIRSVYFDDLDDTCYRKNMAGTDPRVKYRIRCYNGSEDHIRLEKKEKRNGMTAKTSCFLSPDQAHDLIGGRVPEDLFLNLGDQPGVLQELVYFMKTRLFLPKIMVVYDRTPFVCRDGNVRVTLDENIAAGRPEDLFCRHPFLKPAMPSGRELIEVKYDGFLPGYIKDELSLGRLKAETFSKYYLCRKTVGEFL